LIFKVSKRENEMKYAFRHFSMQYDVKSTGLKPGSIYLGFPGSEVAIVCLRK
jgi:hypothetical protein